MKRSAEQPPAQTESQRHSPESSYLRKKWRESVRYLKLLTVLGLSASVIIASYMAYADGVQAEENITYAPAITNPADVRAVSITAQDFSGSHEAYNGSGVGLRTAAGDCDYVLTAQHIFPVHTDSVTVSTSTHAIDLPDGENFTGYDIIVPTPQFNELIGDVAIVKLSSPQFTAQ